MPQPDPVLVPRELLTEVRDLLISGETYMANAPGGLAERCSVAQLALRTILYGDDPNGAARRVR